MSRNIYLASSWRNLHYNSILTLLRKHDHNVFSFREPVEGRRGFHWSDADLNKDNCTMRQYRATILHDERAINGFHTDLAAMTWCDTCVLLLPCGRSANLEAGWCKGSGRKLVIHIPERIEPELMYSLADTLTFTEEELLAELS